MDKNNKMKSAQMETINQSLEQLQLNSNVQELKDSGNEAFKNKKFKESINFYTQAICMSGVPDQELAVLYSNRSVAYLKLGDNLSAEENAKQSIKLSPIWWKGYFRLAMVHKENKNYQLALTNLSLCQQYHDNPESLKDQIDLCKQLIGQQGKEEHFDTNYFCNVNKEVTKRIPNSALTPEMLNCLDGFGLKYYATSEICAEGHNYYLGRGYQQDYKKAADWYGLAAAEGNSEAMYNLAKMYMDGKGVKQDLNEAIRLLEEAAKQPVTFEFKTPWNKNLVSTLGVGEAQHSLGLAYEQGTGVPKNNEKARFWYNRAIKSWSGPSANNMAIIYSTGMGVPVSLDLAIQYWKLGAAMDNERCMENLAHNYFELANYKDMQQWYLYAVNHGSEIIKLCDAKFQKHFQKTVTQNFDQEKFTKALWSELENGPLKHLIDKNVKAAHDTNKRSTNGLLTQLSRSVPCHKIDESTPDSLRKTITLAHRKGFHDFLKLNHPGKVLVSWGHKAELEPKLTLNLFDLKSISLEQMSKKKKDHIFQGFVLNVRLMEDPMDKVNASTAIHSIVRDEFNSYQRLSIYNFSPNKTELQENLGFGSKLSIVNPYYRIALDGSPVIRVDNFNTVFIHSDLKNEKICRYCGNENYEGPTIQCRTCKRCYYCSKRCLKLDASELQHDLVCKKQI